MKPHGTSTLIAMVVFMAAALVQALIESNFSHMRLSTMHDSSGRKVLVLTR